MCILRQLSHNVNPPLRNHAERPGKRHVGKDLEGVGGRSRYPLATLTPYNPGVGAKYPVDPGRFGGHPATKKSTAWDIQETLQECTMNRQIGLGIALSLPLAITAWGCSGEQIESGVKTTGTKLEKAGRAVDKAGEKIKDIKDKVGPELKDLEHKAGQLEQKAGKELKSLEDKAKD